MLGWALKKGFQGATGLRDAPEDRGDDTTQIDAPDTPAPVFAARAIKNAIWGQSGATNKDHAPAKTKPSETQRVKPAANTTTTTNATTASAAEKEIPTDNRSPSKLGGILLTPGTGTSRRKRVSFGQDVKAGNVEPSPFTSSSARDGKQRKKTTLQQAFENARSSIERKDASSQGEDVEDNHTEEEWEWDDENACCNHDVTVDLNEPHSESGKYWKAEWTRYREEAKSDIEQLVKYKANARSFAAKKDTEASQLAQKLKEEQAKVAEMEKKMADMVKPGATRKHGTDEDNAMMRIDLEKQTSLVAEYRDQVKALEARLKEASSESNANASSRHRMNMSPRTEQSIHDVSRELRKARSELRELDRLRDELRRVKSNLATSRERVAELEAQASAEADSELSRITKLEKQLREVKEESRQKDTEIRKLKRDYESLKRDAMSKAADAMQVLQGKNAEIDKLERDIKELKVTNALNQSRDLDAALARHNKITQDLKSGMDSLDKSSRYEKVQPTKRRARAASVQDITLEMTQRSLLQDENDHAPDRNRQAKGHGEGILAEWTADIPTLELQAQEKNRRRETAKQDEESILERMDSLARRQTERSAKQRILQDNGRIKSDVLSNRVNESSGSKVRGHQQPADGALPTDHNQTNNNRRAANAQTTSLAEDKSTMDGAVDRSTRRSRTLQKSTRTAPSNNEAPGIGLVRDQFSRLGVPPTDRNGSGSSARCALPADRHAAALARLQQKRMERRKASGQDLDKENVRP